MFCAKVANMYLPGVMPVGKCHLLVYAEIGRVVHQGQRGRAMEMLPVWRGVLVGRAVLAAADFVRGGRVLAVILVQLAVIEQQVVMGVAKAANKDVPGAFPVAMLDVARYAEISIEANEAGHAMRA